MILYDYHTHMGQFEEIYYNPYKIVEVLAACGIEGAYISSTTSCISWDDENEKKHIIDHIIDECQEAMTTAKRLHLNLKVLLWVIPERYLEGDSVEKMMREFPYGAFKIHPRAHDWNLSDKRICSLMNEICVYAMANKLPIVIHTGVKDFEDPKKFEKWFSDYPSVKFQIAHCKNVGRVAEILENHKNVICDISMGSMSDIKFLINKGLLTQIVFGSDFPITNYFMGEKRTTQKSFLCKEYKQILQNAKQVFEKIR